jgi:hypothetical protein
MLADALPDDFGNARIDAWMATKGIEKRTVTILDRLAYMGKRGWALWSVAQRADGIPRARGPHRNEAAVGIR